MADLAGDLVVPRQPLADSDGITAWTPGDRVVPAMAKVDSDGITAWTPGDVSQKAAQVKIIPLAVGD